MGRDVQTPNTKEESKKVFFSWLNQTRNDVFAIFSLCSFTFEDMTGIEFMVTLDYKLPIWILCPTSKRNCDGFSNFIWLNMLVLFFFISIRTFSSIANKSNSFRMRIIFTFWNESQIHYIHQWILLNVEPWSNLSNAVHWCLHH
jgi:hypothetical protein